MKEIRVVKSPQGGIEVQVFNADRSGILDFVRIPPENIDELIERIRALKDKP